MTKFVLKNEPWLLKIIRAAFPDYRKHNAYVHQFGEGGLNINSYWDGGSRYQYGLVYLPELKAKPLPTSTHPFFDIAAHGYANQENQDLVTDHVGKCNPEAFTSGLCNRSGWYFPW